MLYCDPDDQSWPRGTMHIDLDQGLAYGGDTSAGIYPFREGDFAGFEGGFPLLLFADPADPSELHDGQLVVKGTLFRISPVEGSSRDLWLIVAQPQEAGGEEWRHRSIVLYSIQNGVLAISFTGVIDEEIFPINYVPCGRRTLRYEDLRKFAESSG